MIYGISSRGRYEHDTSVRFVDVSEQSIKPNSFSQKIQMNMHACERDEDAIMIHDVGMM